MTRIEKLTDAQIALFPEYVERWTRIGLSCDPVRLKWATIGVNAAYKAAGLEAPKRIVVCDGPVSAAIAASILRDGKEVGDSVGDSVWDSVGASVGDSVRESVRDSVRASVWDSVWDSIRDSVRDSVRASVWDSVWDSIRDSVRDSVGESVWDSVRESVWESVGDSVGESVWESVRDSVRDSVGESVWESVWEQIYGSHEAGWLSFYGYMRDIGLRQQTDKLRGLLLIGRTCGWWAPYRGVAILQHRHAELHRDGDGRLHNESGMSVRYRDGWGLWSIHGVTVDEQIIMRPETQTVEQIHKEGNEEIRRVRIERYGWERYLAESKAEVRDERFNERDHQPESLRRLKDGTQRFLVNDPSTGRRYALGVPSGIETCEQAQHWMSNGLDRLAIHRS